MICLKCKHVNDENSKVCTNCNSVLNYADTPNAVLDVNSILVADYEYISQTAFRSHEDRARVTSSYIITVGSLLIAILGYQYDKDNAYLYFAFAGLFLLLSLGSLLTLLQIVRLRQAWYESAKAMNHMKEYFIRRIDATETYQLSDAFLWSDETLPSKFKPWSISFLLAIQIAMLGAISLSTSVIFLSLGFEQLNLWLAIGTGAFFFTMQLLLYRRLLLDN